MCVCVCARVCVCAIVVLCFTIVCVCVCILSFLCVSSLPGCCPTAFAMDCLKGIWDETAYWFVYTYTTPRNVVIKDHRLGFLNLFLQFLILIYIVIYVMVIQKGYLAVSPPAGTSRMTIREPDYDKLATNKTTRSSAFAFTLLSRRLSLSLSLTLQWE